MSLKHKNRQCHILNGLREQRPRQNPTSYLFCFYRGCNFSHPIEKKVNGANINYQSLSALSCDMSLKMSTYRKK